MGRRAPGVFCLVPFRVLAAWCVYACMHATARACVLPCVRVCVAGQRTTSLTPCPVLDSPSLSRLACAFSGGDGQSASGGREGESPLPDRRAACAEGRRSVSRGAAAQRARPRGGGVLHADAEHHGRHHGPAARGAGHLRGGEPAEAGQRYSRAGGPSARAPARRRPLSSSSRLRVGGRASAQTGCGARGITLAGTRHRTRHATS